MQKTYAVTGAASGIGAATTEQLTRQGHRVIGIDLQEHANVQIRADLATPEGRQSAVDSILGACDGRLDGLVPCAGLSGLPDRPGHIVASLNYFGSIALIEGLHEALAASGEAAVVGLCSNSTTTAPVPMELVEALDAGDEQQARSVADKVGSILSYPASKMALARWIRAHAPTDEWIGRGITLNAVAPGMTETAMVAEGRADPVLGKAFDAFPIPVGRTARPEEIASLIAYLLGPDARFIVGSIFFIDGGTDAQVRTNDFPSPVSVVPAS